MSENDTDPTTQEKLKKLFTVRNVVKFVASNGAKATVSAIIVNQLPIAETRKEKIQYTVGVYAISSVVAKHASAHIAREYDDAVDFAKNAKETIKKAWNEAQAAESPEQ